MWRQILCVKDINRWALYYDILLHISYYYCMFVFLEVVNTSTKDYVKSYFMNVITVMNVTNKIIYNFEPSNCAKSRYDYNIQLNL